ELALILHILLFLQIIFGSYFPKTQGICVYHFASHMLYIVAYHFMSCLFTSNLNNQVLDYNIIRFLFTFFGIENLLCIYNILLDTTTRGLHELSSNLTKEIGLQTIVTTRATFRPNGILVFLLNIRGMLRYFVAIRMVLYILVFACILKNWCVLLLTTTTKIINRVEIADIIFHDL
ncbi:hypothetical protein ACJX0J_037700, partial [Zea mays]